MIEIGGVPIIASAHSIIIELKNQLLLNDIDLLGKVRPTARNVQFSCPVHSNGVERKPSCGISEMDIKRNNKIIPAGTVHCFTCGYTANIQEFVSRCFNKGTDGGAFGYKWLIKNFASIDIEDRKPLKLNLERGGQVGQVSEIFIDENVLQRYRYIHPYMYHRKLTDKVINYFDIGFDVATNCLTFPVCNKDGKPMFIQRRSTRGKFFNNATDTRKSTTLYALDKVLKNIEKIRELIVCESIIDAVTCWTHKRPAVALMGTGADGQYQLLRGLPIRKFILALDEDIAGDIGCAKLKTHLRESQLLYRFNMPRGAKDLNELDWDEFETLTETLM